MTKVIVHGHAVYKVTDKLFDLICLHTIGKPKTEFYDIVMNLLAANAGEFEYQYQVNIIA